MKKMTKGRVVRLLREAAENRYGGPRSKELLPALRETAKAILAVKNQDCPAAGEPAFFPR